MPSRNRSKAVRNVTMAAWRVGHWRDRGFAGLVASCLLASGGAALAAPTIESLPLAAAYGTGVHSYFAGDYQRSYDDLSQAIEAGTLDPRAYYFRGLTALKLGRLDEAEADFSAGAVREAEGTGSWPIARSLERIQGCDRLKLERHRTRARVATLQLDRRRSDLRYLDVERAEADVLRDRRPVVERVPDAANPFDKDVEQVPARRRPPVAPRTVDMPEPVTEPGLDPAAEPPSDNPFGSGAGLGGADAVAAGGENVAEQRDGRQEREATVGENVAEQTDGRMEREASEAENSAGQRDGQAELDSLR